MRRAAKGSAPLLQERLGRRDPWRVAAVCACLSRATGRQAEPVLRELFRRWPTAERMYRSEHGTRPPVSGQRSPFAPRELASLLRPLGLSTRRSWTIDEAARIAYLSRLAGSTRAEVVEGLSMVKGVGKYAADSMRAFCLGDLSVRSADKEVGPRVRFLRRAARARGRIVGVRRAR